MERQMRDMRITKRVVDSLKATDKDYVAWDADLPGFGVRVRPSGAKSFIAVYRAGSGRKAPLRKLTIASVAKITAEEARAQAKKAIGAAAGGADPAGSKSIERKTLTIADLIDTFLSDHVEAKRKLGTQGHYRDILNRIVRPEIGTAKADKVRRADISRLHLKWKKTPYQANRILAVVGSMYAFGGKRGLVPEIINPARGIEKFPEQGRERFLSSGELEKLGAALRLAETDGIPWRIDEGKPTAKHIPKKARRTVIDPLAAGALRLLLFSGCRLREILHLKWQEVDMERGLLFLSDSKTGRKTIVLNAPALAVLAGLPRVGSYVIPGDNAEMPRTDLKRPWTMVTRQAGLDGLRIHDLRHSFASFGAGGGMGLPIVGKLLGHANATTTARYAHLDADPLRRASNAIASTIAAAMGENPAFNDGKVIPLRK
jgi:integrase